MRALKIPFFLMSFHLLFLTTRKPWILMFCFVSCSELINSNLFFSGRNVSLLNSLKVKYFAKIFWRGKEIMEDFKGI